MRRMNFRDKINYDYYQAKLARKRRQQQADRQIEFWWNNGHRGTAIFVIAFSLIASLPIIYLTYKAIKFWDFLFGWV